MDSQQEFKNFIHAEIEKLKIDKWIEGEKIDKDPGVEYELKWVNDNAENFRNAWNVSKCKTCKKCKNCGYNTLSACEHISCPVV